GIFVAFIYIDRSPVFADEPLICQHAAFNPSRGDHFTREGLELVEASRPDHQLDPPGNLHCSRQSERLPNRLLFPAGIARVRQTPKFARCVEFCGIICGSESEGDLMSDDIDAIKVAAQTYLDGLYEGDADKLATVFHPTSALTWEQDGALKPLPRDEWLKAVRDRASAKARGLARHDEILHIDQSSPTTAF